MANDDLQRFIDELRARVSIADVVGAKVKLTKKGREYQGLCPFHNEKTPSFTVNESKGFYHCFGCGAHGDIIKFEMEANGLPFIDALQKLAHQAGLQMPQLSAKDKKEEDERKSLYEIMETACAFFERELRMPDGASGLKYFTEKRGLSPETLKKFRLGFAPNNNALMAHLKAQGIDEKDMKELGLIAIPEDTSRRPHDFFRNRVMIPITNKQGKIIAFGGRVMEKIEPKYLNSPDTPIFNKRRNLYNLDKAREVAYKEKKLIICEGYMDVISLHKAGIENAIASLGTALTAEQARILARYAKEVVICYDSDEAGQKAAQRAIPILRGAGLLVRVMAVPGNKDPDEFINACGDEGAARFRRLIEQSGNDVEYRLAKLKSGYDLSNENGRIQYLMAAVELLAGLENAIERDVYVSRLSQELNVDKNAILQQMSVSVRKKARAAQRQQQRDMTEQLSARRDTVNPEKRRYVRVANAEERLIACLFHNNDLAQSLNRRVPPEKFVTAFNRRLYQSLLGKIINEETVTSPQITDFSAECTPDEMGRLAKIVQENAGITAKDAEEYVQIILSEGALTDTDKVRGANPADLQAQLDALRKQKK